MFKSSPYEKFWVEPFNWAQLKMGHHSTLHVKQSGCPQNALFEKVKNLDTRGALLGVPNNLILLC